MFHRRFAFHHRACGGFGDMLGENRFDGDPLGFLSGWQQHRHLIADFGAVERDRGKEDAVGFAFKQVMSSTGENLGSEAEMRQYGEQLVHALADGGPLDFTRVYLPLVLGGVLVFDQIIMPDENLNDMLGEIAQLIYQRDSERGDDNELVFNMARQLIDRALAKYGLGL